MVDAPPALVWALAADTNRFDRALGAPRTIYGVVPDDPVSGRPAERVGRARLFWGETQWRERGEWVEGSFFHGERHFDDGPIRLAGLCITVSETGPPTELTTLYYLIGRAPLTEPLASKLRTQTEQTLADYLASVARIAEGAGEPVAGELAAHRARIATARAAADEPAMGPHSPTDERELDHRASRLGTAPVSPPLRERLVDLARSRPDDDVREIRPYELAAAWEEDRRSVLSAFLHAAWAGVYDLRWQTLCPSCKVASDSGGALSELGTHAHCASCDSDYAVDLARNVEAVFQVNPAVRPVDTRLWCAGSPWFRPHVFATLEIPPGSTRVLPRVPEGPTVVRSSTGQTAALSEEAEAWDLSWTGSGFVVAPGTAPRPLVLRNTGDVPITLTVEREGQVPDRVLGTELLTVPEFHGLFSAEAPASGVDLTVTTAVLLFSDLTDSTALYRDVGDARAFALIEQHFRLLREIVEARRGAVLKTMGDAVMAVFHTAGEAVDAALEMVPRVAALHPDHPLALRVGVHQGPVLAVRANDRLDFFGSTVNLAARLEHVATADQVVLTEAMLDQAPVAEQLTRLAHQSTRRDVHLKGLGTVHCVFIDVPRTRREG